MQRWTANGAWAPMLLAAALAAGCGGGGGPAPEAGDGADAVVAEVDGRPIRASRLETVVQAERLRRLSGGGEAGPEPARELYREALATLIDAELLYRAALDRGLTVTPERIDARLAASRSQFESEEAFRDHLAAAGITEAQLRERIERTLLTEAYVGGVTSEVTADESEARRIYDEQRDRFVTEPQRRVAHVVARVPRDAAEPLARAARERIERARRELLGGAPVDEVARRHSDPPYSERGADMGFLARGRMPPEFDDAAFSTGVGRISPVFRTDRGFHVIRVLDVREGTLRPFEEVRTGLLMVLAREQRDRALEAHLADLRRAARIVVFDPSLAAPPGP